MRKSNAAESNGHPKVDNASLVDEMERYCEEHPRGPAAVRRPKLFKRSQTVVALLGATIEKGITGFGDTARAALRAFDARYLAMLRPPKS
jgi:hypothetical protein